MTGNLRTHTVKAGDTLETISREKYGTPDEQTRIIQANPGITDPLTVGAILTIPNLQVDFGDIAITAGAINPAQVSITIGNEDFTYFQNEVFEYSIDGFSAFQFEAPFEPDKLDFRERFKPLEYQDFNAFIGGTRFFAGTVVNIVPSEAEARKVTVSGYAFPGIFVDANMPASSFPIEYDGLTLQEIAESVAKPFGLKVVFEGSPGPAFEQVALNPTDKVFPFLRTLAQQRNFIITNTADGKLKFWRSNPAAEIVANFIQGETFQMSVVPKINGQNYFSDLTGYTTTRSGKIGKRYTVKNPLSVNRLCPINIKMEDIEDGELKQAVEYQAGLMLSASVSYQITLPSWTDSKQRLWQPNTRVNLTAPSAMVYNETELLIDRVKLVKQDNKQIAVLNLVFPGAYSGEFPGVFPWG